MINGIYRSDKYQSVYTLITNREKRSLQDIFEKAITASFIVHYLFSLTNFFGKKLYFDYHTIMEDLDATFMGGLILRHLTIVSNNVYSVNISKYL